MERDAVTAIIVSYNSGERLRRCIDDLVDSGIPAVVIDNASTDGSEEAAAGRDGVRLVRNAVNVGFGAAVNQAVRQVTSQYVLLLNADVTLLAGYVETLAAVLDADPRRAAATGVLVLPEGAVDSTGIEVTTAHWARDRDRGRSPNDVSTSPPFGVSGAACLLRRGAVLEVGGMWEELFVYWEDVELAWRLRRAGYECVLAPAARAWHERGADRSDSTFVEAASFGGRLATVARHEGWRGLLRPSVALVTGVVGARLAVRHPRALLRSRAASLVRAGLEARRGDAGCGWPALDRRVFAPHPWRPWLVAQVTGGRRGLGALTGGRRRLSASQPEPPG